MIRQDATPRVEDARPAPQPRRAPAFSVRQVRLACGLVLFAYVSLHFANHALGNISVEAMESGLALQKLLWQSPPGAILLYGALLTHMGLGFWALYERRQFRWTRLEATQLALGLAIPFLLADHFYGTRVSLSLFGTEKGYAEELLKFCVRSPVAGALQAVLLMIVWTHGCIGVHFWLALKPFYPRIRNLLLSVAVLLPALALLGYFQGGRDTMRAVQDPAWRSQHMTPERIGTEDENARLTRYRGDTIAAIAAILAGVILGAGVSPVARAARRLDQPDLSGSNHPRSARPERARSKPAPRHSARPCLRRPRPLLDLPHPGAGRPRRPA